MVDDVLLAKAAIIERCLKRIAEDYIGHEAEFAEDCMRQDAIILNLQRACEAAIDGAMHLVRTGHLGLPQESREAFSLMQKAGLLEPQLGDKMRAMVGFRNVAVHDYGSLNLDIVRAIVEKRLGDLRAFAKLLIQHAG
ncbi:MAG: DUF86 domain-containing protein [Nitrospirota bacterium]